MIAINFDALQKEVLEGEIKTFPQHKLRASSLGHGCDRFLYYSIANWQDRIPHDTGLQSVFDVGNVLEEHHALPRLRKMRGLKIVSTQSQYKLDNPDISMTIDGKFFVEEPNEYIMAPVGSRIPFEIKTITPWDFAKLNTIQDFTRSKKSHQRAYVTQIQLYLLGTGAELGFMILVNKVNGLLKFIPVTIDIDFCDEVIKKAQRIYKALDEKAPPERIDDWTVCERCDFRQICLPSASFEGIKIMDQAELEQKLAAREDLKVQADKYKELDEEIKESMKATGAGQYLVGQWTIRVVERTRKAYEVKEGTYLDTRILRMK